MECLLRYFIAGHSQITVEEELKNRVKEKEIIPALLNIKEFCDYLGIGETKARELLHDPGNGFTVRIEKRRNRA